MRYVERSEAIPESLRERHAEAMRLFVEEVNYHAELLARTVQYLGGTQDPRVLGTGDLLEEYPYYGGSPLHPDYKPPEGR